MEFIESVLVMDDEKDIHYSFQRNFQKLGWHLQFASSAEEGLKMIARRPPSVVVMDVRMAGISGLDALARIRQSHTHLPVVMMTAHGTTKTAIEAMKCGAFDYLIKPFEVERMQQTVAAALKVARDMRERVSYQPLLQSEEYDQGIIGKSRPMQEVYKLIGQVSGSDVPVMITGETGTGKELVVRAIVQHGTRADKPFLAINCAAISENLLESELFGHEKGAFTGATDRRIGKFEQCDHGTIFLDEIGDMPLPTQAKILRVLQEGEFSRLGSNQNIKVNIRFLAATHQNLAKRIATGAFREDLYYRLNVVHIHLPPLRDRISDLPMLVEYFLQRLPRSKGTSAFQISKEALQKLISHAWPGNVRELRNIIEQASVTASSRTLSEQDIQFQRSEFPTIVDGSSTSPLTSSLEEAIDNLFRGAARDPRMKLLPFAERQLITRALVQTNGNQMQAARLLGITRATLRKRVEKFGIRKKLTVL